MTPMTLFRQLQTRGVQFEIVAECPTTLRMVDPAGLASAQERDLLRAGKHEILQYLKDSKQLPLRPINSTARLHMLNSHGVVTHDPAKCFMWTREILEYRWWYASAFPPPTV